MACWYKDLVPSYLNWRGCCVSMSCIGRSVFSLLIAFWVIATQAAPAVMAVIHHRHRSKDTNATGRTEHGLAAHKHRKLVTEHTVVMYSGSQRKTIKIVQHHIRHHKGGSRLAKQSKTHYAYPFDIFMPSPPAFELGPLAEDLANSIRSAFFQGVADSYPSRTLVRAGAVFYHPLKGGIFWRREPVSYIIIHSTETGIPQGASRVIDSWNSMGRRHPGAQYVIDRDGTIFQALDPDLASVHVNVFKTLPGINNDNSVGIEMCHTGSQEYTDSQVNSLVKLVVYLQSRYQVPDINVITHRYAQQGDHTDPVNFAWDKFITDKERFERRAAAMKVTMFANDALSWQTAILPLPEPFLQMHQRVRLVPRALTVPPKEITSKTLIRDMFSPLTPVPSMTSTPGPTRLLPALSPTTVVFPTTADPATTRLVPMAAQTRWVPATTEDTSRVTNVPTHATSVKVPPANTVSVKSSPVSEQRSISKIPLGLPLRGVIELPSDTAAKVFNHSGEAKSTNTSRQYPNWLAPVPGDHP